MKPKLMTAVDEPLPGIADQGVEPGNRSDPKAAGDDSGPSADQRYQKNILVTAKGGGISFMGRVFEYLVRFIFSIIVARTLHAEQYGLYILGLTLAQIASAMALLGLQTGLIRYLTPAIAKRDDARMWGVVQICLGIPALLSLVIAAGLFVLAEPISVFAFHDQRLIPIIRVVSLCVPLDAVTFIAYVIVISFKEPKYMVLVGDILIPLVKLLLTVGFLMFGWGTLGAISAYVIASAMGLITLMFFVNLLFPLKRPLNSAERPTREILRYSLPVHLAYVLNTLRGTLETLVLGFFGLTTGVGIYSIALRLSSLESMMFLAIGNISTPIIAELHSRGNHAQLKSFYQTTTKWILTFNIPLFLTFAILANPILSIFGADFTNGSLGLVILALGALVYTGTGLGANMLDMTDHTRMNSANSVIMVVVTIGLDLLLIPRWGVLGAAVASAFSTVIVNLVSMTEVFILHKMLPYDPSILKLLAAGAVSAVITYFLVQYLHLPSILLIVVGAITLWGIYLLIMVSLGFSDEDRMIISSAQYRLKMLLPKRTPIVG